MTRRPLLLPLLAVAALPFRVPIEVGGNDLEPARPALPRRRRRRARLRRAGAAARPGAAGARARVGAGLDGAAAGAVRRPLRRAGDLLGRLREGAPADRLLLRPVRAAVRAAGAGRVDAEAAALVLRRAGRARARLLVHRLRRVRDETHLPQPEADRLERAAHLLPHELGLLRPEHLRAFPRRRDAGGRDARAAHEAARADRRRHRRAGGAVGGARADAVAVELRRAAGRARACWRCSNGACGGRCCRPRSSSRSRPPRSRSRPAPSGSTSATSTPPPAAAPGSSPAAAASSPSARCRASAQAPSRSSTAIATAPAPTAP